MSYFGFDKMSDAEREDFSRRLKENMTRSPFDPRFDHSLPMTPPQYEEQLLTTTRAWMDVATKCNRLFGNPYPQHGPEGEFAKREYERALQNQLKAHWVRWAQRYGPESLPPELQEKYKRVKRERCLIPIKRKEYEDLER